MHRFKLNTYYYSFLVWKNDQDLSTKPSKIRDSKNKKEENSKKKSPSAAAADEEAICGLIHNDCYRSIINKFFEFYKFNESEADPSQALFVDKDNLIEIFKGEIIEYLNHSKDINNNENNADAKYKFQYYQGLNDLIIFFILLKKTTQAHIEKNSVQAEKNGSFNLNKKIISYLKNENKQTSLRFDLYKFLDFLFHRNFKPFCLIKLNQGHKNAFDNSKLLIENCGSKHKPDDSNALKMKKILPTVVKYIEIINPKVKRRLFDLNKIDPFYSLGWILTWFTHNNENIFKNFRIIDYLVFSEINTIFYLVAVVIKF